jgi:glycosyltransferase involved in cell wall biosynthesis
MSKKKIDLTIVVITRNEEEMIGDCLGSTVEGAEAAAKAGVIKSYEIIHADSASTDGTVEIARKYPVKTLQLGSDWPLSAGAGLYTGYRHARGRYFMPMGGDMILKKDWIINALPELRKDKKLGGVTGFEEEYTTGDGYLHAEMQETLEKTLKPGYVDRAGIAIFRMDVLREVGGYNPYLVGGEDMDISFRIIHAGYRLLRIPDTSVVHYWSKKSSKINLVNMLKSAWKWSVGEGQGARYGLYGRGYVKKQISKYFRMRQLYTYWYFMVMLAMAGVNMAAFFIDTAHAMYVIAVDVLFIISVIALKTRYGLTIKDLKDLVMNIFTLWHKSLGFLIGYLQKPKPIESYPTDVKEIK